MQAELKIENGTIMAKRIHCDPWFRIPTKKRIAHGLAINVEQWINPMEHTSVFVLDRLRTSMMRGSGCLEGECSMRGGYCRPTIVEWGFPTLLVCHDYRQSPGLARLLSPEGLVLSGSNIYGPSFTNAFGICLGEPFDPLTIKPVELLVTNTANNDLEWHGDVIIGQIQEEEINDQPLFIASEWPETDVLRWTVPSQIRESLDALLRP